MVNSGLATQRGVAAVLWFCSYMWGNLFSESFLLIIILHTFSKHRRRLPNNPIYSTNQIHTVLLFTLLILNNNSTIISGDIM